VTERDRHRLSPVPGRRAQRRQEVRTFSTPTGELVRWADWLTAAGCTHVALESTGVYWRAIYNFLEGRFEMAPTRRPFLATEPRRVVVGLQGIGQPLVAIRVGESLIRRLDIRIAKMRRYIERIVASPRVSVEAQDGVGALVR